MTKWRKSREIRHSPARTFAMMQRERTDVMALQLRPNCEYCDKDLPPIGDGRAHLLL